MAIKIAGTTVIDNSRVATLAGIIVGPSSRVAIDVAAATGTSTVLTFSTGSYRSAEVSLQILQGVNYEITKFLVASNGTDVYLEEYGKIGPPTDVVLSASVATNIVTVTATATLSASYRGHATLITV